MILEKEHATGTVMADAMARAREKRDSQMTEADRLNNQPVRVRILMIIRERLREQNQYKFTAGAMFHILHALDDTVMPTAVEKALTMLHATGVLESEHGARKPDSCYYFKKSLKSLEARLAQFGVTYSEEKEAVPAAPPKTDLNIEKEPAMQHPDPTPDTPPTVPVGVTIGGNAQPGPQKRKPIAEAFEEIIPQLPEQFDIRESLALVNAYRHDDPYPINTVRNHVMRLIEEGRVHQSGTRAMTAAPPRKLYSLTKATSDAAPPPVGEPETAPAPETAPTPQPASAASAGQSSNSQILDQVIDLLSQLDLSRQSADDLPVEDLIKQLHRVPSQALLSELMKRTG